MGGEVERAGLGRVLRAGAVLVTIAALAACEPMPHTDVTERAAPGAGADLALLSGNRRFVVLTATAAGPVAPGPGNWRVDRDTGDAVALPAGTPERISADGTRVLLLAGGGQTLWDEGTVSSPTGVLASDLGSRAFVAGDGTVQTQDLATGTTTPVEAAFPRPPGTTATVLGVSDDGDTVAYRFASTIRVVDLGAGSSVDIASLAGSDTTEEVLLAAGGSALARLTSTQSCYEDLNGFLVCDQVSATIDWIEIPSGVVLAHHDNPTAEVATFTRIADSGRAVWSYQQDVVGAGSAGCPYAPGMAGAFCAVSASLVEMSIAGVLVEPLGPGYGRGLEISSNGRFAALSREQEGYASFMPLVPVQVADRLSDGPRWEALDAGPPATSTGAHVSDDGTVISTTTDDGGWFDFEA